MRPDAPRTAYRQSRSAFVFLLLLVSLASGSIAGAPRLDDDDCGPVHAFYYLWYGTPAVDGRWSHWNHAVLPHWDPAVRARHPHGASHDPGRGRLHAPFYPAAGPYSSADAAVFTSHLREAEAAGIDVLVLSWWGPAWRRNTSDGQGVPTDARLSPAFESASTALAASQARGGRGVRLAIHLEPYPGRNASSVKTDVADVLARLGGSPAFARARGRPVFYAYDSYHVPSESWAAVLTAPGGWEGANAAAAIAAGRPLDPVPPAWESDPTRRPYVLGLWLGLGDGPSLAAAGFDGGYTYFASEAVSPAAGVSHWRDLAAAAESVGNLRFVPCVGPGYDDTKIRPWNGAASRPREGGRRYARQWAAAVAAVGRGGWVGVTSFNEWGEGSQIEPARGMETPTDSTAESSVDSSWAGYQDYGPGCGELYYRLTAKWATRLRDGGDVGDPGSDEL